MSTPVEVRGAASPEELAAVLAALSRFGGERPAARTGLQGWRDVRVAALRRCTDRPAASG